MQDATARRRLMAVMLALFVSAGCTLAPTPTDERAEPGSADLIDAARTLQKTQPAAEPVEEAIALSHRVTAQMPQQARRDAPGRAQPSALAHIRLPSETTDRESYGHFDDNPVKRVAEHPVSTFSIDVDTGAYANVRRFLNAGRLPRRDAVRVEELVNYFAYSYPAPDTAARPFNVTTELAPAPWNSHRLLLHIGIKGYQVARQDLPPANLVFLIDVSGSMQAPNKLELLKRALALLARQLRSQDQVAIVVYAGASGVVLEPVAGTARARIMTALEGLRAGGSTNGGAGIRLAYALARQAYNPDSINRVILATDGDFNVGTVNLEALKDLIAEQREHGISLTTLGFGTGNYNDHLMEQLADIGNGNYAYIDNLKEAQKVLVNELSSTMHTIAKDVKIQVEFNPAAVAEYRLIGYENRALRREDFNNDKVDAGDIGAGHTVTALYELGLQDSADLLIERLRYAAKTSNPTTHNDEIAFLRLRYKLPGADTSLLDESQLDRNDIIDDANQASADFRFAAAVAAFGQVLRGGRYTGDFGYEDISALAVGARGTDASGYRGEFLQLVRLASTLSQQQTRR